MSRLSRWSQRKLADKESPTEAAEKPVSGLLETAEAGQPVQRQQEQVVQRQEQDSECLEPVDRHSTQSVDNDGDGEHVDVVADSTALPDPDSLPAGSDIRAYLDPGVDKALRKKALRRLFSAERYNVRDGLDDYDEDFREKLKPLSEHVAGRLRQHFEHHWQTPQDEAKPESETPQKAAALAHEHTPGPHDAQHAATSGTAEPGNPEGSDKTAQQDHDTRTGPVTGFQSSGQA
uniref:DUF3306 domain-containing protein n=1 Tax=Halomonas sp. TaxID=1486246 RepID=UPI00260E8AD4|nr:DUF3306 domain-containing protein [Halomonas sp.]